MARLAQIIDAAERSGCLNVRSDELAHQLPGSTPKALRLALDRLRRQGRIVQPSRGAGHWVVVPLQDAALGAPSLETWLHEYMGKTLGLPYYVCLLSAAETYGASPHAVTVTQVVVPRPRRSIQVGRHKLVFIVRREMSVPTQWYETAAGRFKVSTPEFTALELVQRQALVGGAGRVSAVLESLMPSISLTALPSAMSALGEVPTIQRLGALLSLGHHHAACVAVAQWLSNQRTRIISLSPHQPEKSILDQQFKVLIPTSFCSASA